MRRFIHRWSSVFAQRRFYWRILAVFQRGRFYVGKRAFGFKFSASNTFTKLGIFLALARAAIPVVFRAIYCAGRPTCYNSPMAVVDHFIV